MTSCKGLGGQVQAREIAAFDEEQISSIQSIEAELLMAKTAKNNQTFQSSFPLSVRSRVCHLESCLHRSARAMVFLW